MQPGDDDTIELLSYANAGEISPSSSKAGPYFLLAAKWIAIGVSSIAFLLLMIETSGDGGTVLACSRCAAVKETTRFHFFGMELTENTKTVDSELTKCLLPYMSGKCMHKWRLVSDWTPSVRSCGRGGSIMVANWRISDLPDFPALISKKLAEDPSFLDRVQFGLASDLFDLPEMKALNVEALRIATASSQPTE